MTALSNSSARIEIFWNLLFQSVTIIPTQNQKLCCSCVTVEHSYSVSVSQKKKKNAIIGKSKAFHMFRSIYSASSWLHLKRNYSYNKLKILTRSWEFHLILIHILSFQCKKPDTETCETASKTSDASHPRNVNQRDLITWTFFFTTNHSTAEKET